MKQEPKQVIVIRKDLNMRKGKMISQGSHVSMKVFLDLCEKNDNTYTFKFEPDSDWDRWLNGFFTKVVVSCDSEKELEELYQQAKDKGLPCSMIVDVGLTEFHNVPTKTCIAIGPADPEDVNEITKHLKLL